MILGLILITLNRLKEEKNRYVMNLETQYTLKQGQVELDPAPFVPDFRDAILIDRKVVEDLNSKIKVSSSAKSLLSLRIQ